MKVTKKSLFRLQVVLIVLVLEFFSTQSRRHNPKADEIERLINYTHSIIWKCSDTECPPGFGLSVQCGSSVSISKSIECIPCVEGVSYSDSSDYSVCKGCKHCGENQEKSGNCTVVHDNMQCFGCKDGYYQDKISDDCHPCSACCGNNDRIQECENSGLSPEKQCRETSTNCHPPLAKPTEKSGKFQEKTGHKKIGSTRNHSHEAIWSIVGVIVGVLGVLAILIFLKTTGCMTRVQSFFQKFLCRTSNSGRNTMEFDDSRVDDELLQLDVEKGTYAEDGVTEGALDKAGDQTVCMKNKLKYYRQLSCPEKRVLEPQPDPLRSHSHTGCQGNLNESQKVLLDVEHEERLKSGRQKAENHIKEAEQTATVTESQQNPFEDPLPKHPHRSNSSIAVTSGELFSRKAFAEQPKVLSVPSMNQATSTTGLNSTQIPQVPQDFQERLMKKKVRDIPIKFYRRICTRLDVKRDDLWDDFRLFGEKIGLGKDECELLGQHRSPTDVMMQRFDSQRDSCIGKLRCILEEMVRFDVIEVIDEWVRKEWLDDQTPDLIIL